MFAECLAVGLACGDQRRLTGSGSALKAFRDNALYIYTLLYFLSRDAMGRMKMQVRKNQVEMSAQASTDGATIDGSRCETDITKHPNKHVNLRNNFKVGPRE